MASVVQKPSGDVMEGIIARQERIIRRMKGLLLQALPIVNCARKNSRGTEKLYQDISNEIDQTG